MLEFIALNYELIGLVILGVVGAFFVARRKSINAVSEILEHGKDELAENIKENHEKYAEYVYSKLPAKARIFLTKKIIDKIILEFAEAIDEDQDLDKIK